MLSFPGARELADLILNADVQDYIK